MKHINNIKESKKKPDLAHPVDFAPASCRFWSVGLDAVTIVCDRDRFATATLRCQLVASDCVAAVLFGCLVWLCVCLLSRSIILAMVVFEHPNKNKNYQSFSGLPIFKSMPSSVQKISAPCEMIAKRFRVDRLCHICPYMLIAFAHVAMQGFLKNLNPNQMAMILKVKLSQNSKEDPNHA